MQLEQAFLNLILNAVQAMPQGGRLTIATRATSGGAIAGKAGSIVIEFKDTGEGMTEDQCQRVFISLLSTTKSKGTGLGLAIVTRVIETHRGKMKVQSRVGHGTTMSVTLPV